jgi:hypothetical protein
LIAWYIGCPGAGKTTLALAHAAQRAVDRDVPLLVIDAEGDPRTTAKMRRCATPADWARELAEGWRLCSWSVSSLASTPDDWAAAIERRGSCVVLVDGAHALLTAHARAGDAWVRLQRVHRHRKLDLLLTTHHLGGDVPQVVQATAPELCVFRTTAPAALDVLERAWGLDRARIAALPRGRYVRVTTGFGDSS